MDPTLLASSSKLGLSLEIDKSIFVFFKNNFFLDPTVNYIFAYFIHFLSYLAKTTKLLYLSHLTPNQENMGTLFPSTFKVEGQITGI